LYLYIDVHYYYAENNRISNEYEFVLTKLPLTVQHTYEFHLQLDHYL